MQKNITTNIKDLLKEKIRNRAQIKLMNLKKISKKTIFYYINPESKNFFEKTRVKRKFSRSFKAKLEGTQEEQKLLIRTLIAQKTINKLILETKKNKRLTDAYLKYISKNIQSRKMLQTFRLKVFLDDAYVTLYPNSAITDKGVVFVSKAMKSFRALQNVSLDFSLCPHVSDIGIAKLSKVLGMLKVSHNMVLNFCRCNIKEKGAAKVGKNLKKLKSTLNLVLALSTNHLIGNKGVTALSKSLGSLNAPQSIVIKVQNCSIGNEGITNLRRNLNPLLSLKIHI